MQPVPASEDEFNALCRQLRAELAHFGERDHVDARGRHRHTFASLYYELVILHGPRYLDHLAREARRRGCTLARLEAQLSVHLCCTELELVRASVGDLGVDRHIVDRLAEMLGCHPTDLVRRGPAPSWLPVLGAIAADEPSELAA